jgi:hypothetical protein
MHYIRGFLIYRVTLTRPSPLKMNKRCSNCRLVNYSTAQTCARCGTALNESENIPSNGTFTKSGILRRAVVCVMVLMIVLLGFYTSLIVSADRLHPAKAAQIAAAIDVLEQKGFKDEVFVLRRLAVFRANDNWLNASVAKENAYAATNFPFEIVTVYPNFFSGTRDDLERAAILLHEAKHLQGKDEKEAYGFVWKNRKRLGWTSEDYYYSEIWHESRRRTKEYSPELFVCKINDFDDCTE